MGRSFVAIQQSGRLQQLIATFYNCKVNIFVNTSANQMEQIAFCTKYTPIRSITRISYLTALKAAKFCKFSTKFLLFTGILDFIIKKRQTFTKFFFL